MPPKAAPFRRPQPGPSAAPDSTPRDQQLGGAALLKRIQQEDVFSSVVMEDELTVSNQSATNPSEIEKEFDQFAERMKSTRRSFYVSSQGATQNVFQIRSNFFEDDTDAVRYYKENELVDEIPADKESQIRTSNSTTREKWMQCCRLEFGKRRRKFLAKFPSMRYFVIWYFIPILLVLSAFLAYQWPLWDVLIDIDTDEHCKTLGVTAEATPSEIKKAYRLLVKQWHPDLNPDCGMTCRNMMMKIQAAHDTLLARGDRANELANKYKEALLQLRSILFFRTYQMAFHSSEFLNMLVLSKDGFSSWFPFLASHKKTFRMTTALVTIATFTVMEIFFVSGFNLIIILQVFYFTVNAFRSSSQREEMEKVSKRCNFDIVRDLVFFLLPAVGAHIAHFMFFEKYPQLDQFSWQLVLGILYLSSHLARFAPNLFDNFAFRKCSISLEYVSKPDLKFSRMEFLKTELGVLADDLFAFSSHVPFMFRFTALLVHAAYLIQMRFLPWDAPAIGKIQSRFMQQDDDGTTPSRRSTGSGDESGLSSADKKPLSDKETQLFMNIDNEDTSWLSIVVGKYHQTILRHVNSFRQGSRADENTKVDCQVRASHDLKSLFIIIAYQKPNQPTHFEIRQQIHDPESAAIIAREVGVTGVNLFPDIRTQATPEQAIERYKYIMGANWEKMCSDIFRESTTEKPLPLWPVVKPLAIALAFSVIVLSCVVITGPVVPPGSEREVFDPFLPPLIIPRFGHILPEEHILNAGGGNVPLRFSPEMPLIGPDLYDTLRQLSMYSTEEVEFESKGVQKAETKKKKSANSKQPPGGEGKKKSGQGRRR